MSSDSLMADDIFNCRQCGECCKGFGGTYMTSEDIRAIAAFIHTDPQHFLENYCQFSGSKPVLAQASNGYCIFWKDKICTIHPVKPRMCKAWPFIPSILKDPGNWFIMAGSCPGIRTDVDLRQVVECVRKQIHK
jgi:uncharacterized protein